MSERALGDKSCRHCGAAIRYVKGPDVWLHVATSARECDATRHPAGAETRDRAEPRDK